MKSEKELRERQGEGEGRGRGEEKGEEKVEGGRITESPPVCLYFQTGSCYESRLFVFKRSVSEYSSIENSIV